MVLDWQREDSSKRHVQVVERREARADCQRT